VAPNTSPDPASTISTTSPVPTPTSSSTGSTVAAPPVIESVDQPLGTLTWLNEPRSAGELVVPLDHDDPDGPRTIVSFERRFSRVPEERIGALFVNPGGPGGSARALARDGVFTFTGNLLDSFDVIGVEPRGVLGPLAVDCEFDRADLEFGTDAWPDDEAESGALTAGLIADGRQCFERYGDVLRHISTMDTVHDMAAVAAALGEEQVSYLGFSYGSVLGAAFITEYPELIRAAVFDAVAYRPTDLVDGYRRSRQSRERYLEQLVDGCAAEGCAVEDPIGALERVVEHAENGDLDTDPDQPVVNEGALFTVVFGSQKAYSGGVRTRLFDAVAAALAGDASLLQREARAVINYQSDFGALTAINCLDFPRGVAEIPESLQADIASETPLLSRLFPVDDSVEGVCGYWPVPPEPLPDPLSGEGAGPVLLVTATGDPVTPTEGADDLAAQLVDAHHLYVDIDRHIVYSSAGSLAQRCATDAIDTFLVDLVRPPDGATC
jgi:pimeloyl-ACP methyl ester carboxylesterase